MITCFSVTRMYHPSHNSEEVEIVVDVLYSKTSYPQNRLNAVIFTV